MKEREYMLSLYEIYNRLLTEKEKNYFEYYFYEDYSLQEIADNNKVSKSYVGKYLNGIAIKLKRFEKALSLYEKNKKIKEIIIDLDVDTKTKIEELL
ncbi:MAG: DNA-binding protein [Bacilli bacterium]|nr:DNA-binding protein [Bacilli bacterium]